MGVFPFPMPFSGPPKFGTMFTPASLFAASEPGGWYDPSDLTTLFQDAAGTTPVTAVEQPVGLVLDKSRGLVLWSNLVPSSVSATGWGSLFGNPGTLVSGNQVTFGTQFDVWRYVVSSTTAGARYEFRFTAKWISGNTTLAFYHDGSATSSFTTSFTVTSTPQEFVVRPLGAAGGGQIIFGFQERNASNFATVEITNVSVRLIPGSHASQGTAASRPVLSARYNLLTRTEAFDNGAWSKPNATITADQATSPTGTNTADRLAEKTATATPNVFQVVTTNPAGTYSYSCAVKKDTQRYAIVSFAQSGGAYTAACIDLDDGTITKSGVSTGVTAPSVPTSVSLGDGWYRVTVYGTTTAALNSVAVQPSNTANPTFGAFGDYSYSGDSTKAIYIWGADLRVSNDGVGLPSYQRVTTSTDYDTTGFPMYLRFDGTDDSLSTGSIDFSSTDKVSLVAGLRKISDAAAGLVAELSASWTANNGAFAVIASSDKVSLAGPYYRFTTHGDTVGTTLDQQALAGSLSAPVSNVLTGLGDIYGDRVTIRINGSQIEQSTGDQGSGNFGNYPLYIGLRNNASLPFNGRIYGLIVRGAASTDAQIASTEAWLNGKTKAYAA